ncbi:hypothetical protein GQ600_25213 [Phytophthora cactorum]|nr:hypothetical protein GQ600_25213 [Phytophthora cactorum]
MAPKRPGRTRGENGKGRHQDMVKRRVDTYQVRLAAINHYREHRNMNDTLAKFYPGVESALGDTTYNTQVNLFVGKEACQDRGDLHDHEGRPTENRPGFGNGNGAVT